ncbi:MAG TPA: M35 family metallo-endopeptidase [Thermoanaerobaculia bacterium]|nr:M35 family metallo-endopeptidase [Thermoanaerobaculia bacterium]
MFLKTTITTRLALAILLAFAGVCAASAAPEGRLVAMTEMAGDSQAVYDGSEALTARWTLHNDTLETRRVLVWHTPLAGFTNDLFYVERDGEPVPYTGRLMKWGEPTEADYVEIESGGSVWATFDPSEVYDMSQPGQYTIVYRSELLEHESLHGRHAPAVKGAPGVQIQSADVVASELVLKLNWIIKAPKGGGGQPLAPAFVACTDERQATLLEALATAAHMSTESRGYLQSLPVPQRPSDFRYDEWFGVYDATNYSTVTTNFLAIESAFLTRRVSFHCDCESSSFAFVYPTKPYEIHLCNAFWNATMTGRDSKGGTLIHEMSHFNVVAGTDDVVYGQTACRGLADTQPHNAIRNADSHEYFAEAGTP